MCSCQGFDRQGKENCGVAFAVSRAVTAAGMGTLGVIT